MSMIARSRGTARRRPAASGFAIYDDFASSTRNTTKWPAVTGATGITFPSGRARMSYLKLTDSLVGGCALVSPTIVDLTTMTVELRVAGVSGGGDYGTESGFMLYPAGAGNVFPGGNDPTSDLITMFAGANGTGMTYRVTTGYTKSSTTGTISSTEKRWRVRASGATVYFETSTDGVTWTTRRTATGVTWPLTSLALVLYAHNYNTDTPDQYIEYEEVWVG